LHTGPVYLVGIFAGLVLAHPTRADDTPKTVQIGRAGPASLDEAGFFNAISEARVLEQWRANRIPPVEALRSADLRRRVVIKALETRVVRTEVDRRGLLPEPADMTTALANAALGRSYAADLTGAPPADLEARLAAKYVSPVARVRAVAADLLGTRALAEALLNEVDDATHRARWIRESTRIKLDLLFVPRVPTSKEIEATVKLRPDDIDIWYAVHAARYMRPERARVRRLFAKAADASSAASQAARARIDGWAARLRAGDDLDAVMALGDGPEAERGGKVGRVTRAQTTAVFEVEPGEQTPPVRTDDAPGWMLYHVESVLPALDRPSHDSALRREIAATLQREGDALPHAMQVAERSRALLVTRPDSAMLKGWLKSNRVKRQETKAFHRSARTLVPGIGLAPALVDAAFALRTPGAVTPVVRVRQDYLVARLVERTAPAPADWPAAKVEYVEAWKQRTRSTVVEDWLSGRLAGEPLWIDMPRIIAIEIPGVGPAVDKRGRGRGARRSISSP
jgi:hypothetical protein